MISRLASPSAVPSAADLRGFRYGLEPLLRRQEWKLAKLGMRLREATDRVQGLDAELARLRAQYSEAARSAAYPVRGSFDPTHHGRVLTYLARLQTGIVEQQQQREEHRKQLESLRASYFQEQRQLDALDHHRGQQAGAYAVEWLRKLSVAADDDWLIRTGSTA